MALTRPLLERFPVLTADFFPLLDLPTPVQRSTLAPDLWIKRDDATGAPIGGSKARVMEFCLRRFAAAGRTVVALGPEGSNWLANLAWASRAHGLDVELWTFPQILNDHARRNRDALSGTPRMHATGPAEYLTRSIVRGARLLSNRTLLAPMGGSAPFTAAAHVNAILELAGQIDAAALPMPRRIYVALGSAGTAAGLLAGLALARLPIELVAVPITTRLLANRRRVLRLARRTLDTLGARVTVEPGRLRLIREFCGRYGEPTPAGRAARARFRDADGIELDDSYTAKAAAAMLTELDRPGPALFWNTFAPRA
jgi:1-aminocyclopropane-1-carboxylate deaminase/D-cysteine desulfhydrase-like pyridoxal-dependent ACC family enzyme